MADNYQTNPNPQQAPEMVAQGQKKSKKKTFIILGIIGGIVLLILVALLLGGGSDDTPKTEAIGDTTAAVQADADTTEAAEPQGKINAGTAITIDDLKISYISCDANCKKLSEYWEPSEGMKVIRAEFSFENTGSSDISLNGFECYADGQKCEEFYGADDYSSPTLETVSAGRTIKGIVYYEVPKDTTEIELEYEASFWSDEKIIFVVK